MKRTMFVLKFDLEADQMMRSSVLGDGNHDVHCVVSTLIISDSDAGIVCMIISVKTWLSGL